VYSATILKPKVLMWLIFLENLGILETILDIYRKNYTLFVCKLLLVQMMGIKCEIILITQLYR